MLVMVSRRELVKYPIISLVRQEEGPSPPRSHTKITTPHDSAFAGKSIRVYDIDFGIHPRYNTSGKGTVSAPQL